MHVPLFPLGLVLFPDGVLPLRIFEPRYLTMIGECMRTATPFGVVMIIEGRDAGGDAIFTNTGTLAIVEDFDQLEDGMLGVSCRGTRRFKVIEYKHQADKLVVAEIELLTEESDQGLPVEFPAMSAFVQQLCQREEMKEWVEGLNPQWQDGEWLSCRLSELLPLSTEARQALLEMPYGERLRQLEKVMKENQIMEKLA